MPHPFEDQAPYKRVISDETNATDRQWLRMLASAFHGASYENLVEAGVPKEIVREFLGVVALDQRYNGPGQ